MIIPPLNDTHCLGLLHDHAHKDCQIPAIVDLARVFASPEEVAAFLRTRPRRLDFGNVRDGPRVPCRPTQRLRTLPNDPNCYESTRMYLSLAEVLDPATARTSMTIRVGPGYHTFPVENEQPVILDPIAPRNAMQAGLYHCAPNPTQLLAQPQPWLFGIARRAPCAPWHAARVENGIRAVQLHGHHNLTDLATLLAVAEAEARLWGPDGICAYRRAVSDICRHIQRLPSPSPAIEEMLWQHGKRKRLADERKEPWSPGPYRRLFPGVSRREAGPKPL